MDGSQTTCSEQHSDTPRTQRASRLIYTHQTKSCKTLPKRIKMFEEWQTVGFNSANKSGLECLLWSSPVIYSPNVTAHHTISIAVINVLFLHILVYNHIYAKQIERFPMTTPFKGNLLKYDFHQTLTLSDLIHHLAPALLYCCGAFTKQIVKLLGRNIIYNMTRK